MTALVTILVILLACAFISLAALIITGVQYACKLRAAKKRLKAAEDHAFKSGYDATTRALASGVTVEDIRQYWKGDSEHFDQGVHARLAVADMENLRSKSC